MSQATSSAMVLGRMGLGDEHDQCVIRDQRDRREIFEDVVGDVWPDRRADAHGAGRGAEQSVAVGRGFRDQVRRKPAASARPVLDHKRAAKRFLKFLGDDTRDGIGPAARAKSDHDPDGMVGIVILLGAGSNRPGS